MSKGWLIVAVCSVSLVCAAGVAAQDASQYSTQPADQTAAPVKVTGKGTCECGAHPPGPPKDRVVTPYAGEPADLSPYSKFAAPYDLNYIHPNIYSGAARDIPEPKNSPKCASASSGLSSPILNRSLACACCTARNWPWRRPTPAAAMAASPSG